MIVYFTKGSRYVATINFKNTDGVYTDGSWKLHLIHNTGKDIPTNITLSPDALDRLVLGVFDPSLVRQTGTEFIDIEEGLISAAPQLNL